MRYVPYMSHAFQTSDVSVKGIPFYCMPKHTLSQHWPLAVLRVISFQSQKVAKSGIFLISRQKGGSQKVIKSTINRYEVPFLTLSSNYPLK